MSLFLLTSKDGPLSITFKGGEIILDKDSEFEDYTYEATSVQIKCTRITTKSPIEKLIDSVFNQVNDDDTYTPCDDDINFHLNDF